MTPPKPKACPHCGAIPSLNRRPKAPDPVARAFVEACCVPDRTVRSSSADLWAALLAYCAETGQPPCTQRALGLSLSLHPSITHVRLPGGRRAWVGIRILPTPVDTPDPS